MASTLDGDDPGASETTTRLATRADGQVAYRLRAIVRQGTAASLPAVWERYPTADAARASVRAMYHDDRVLRAFIVTDEAPPRFVEWVER
jgi:hypothetical protein